MSRLKQLLTASILFAVLAAPAYAYIDPGSGSMILQGFLAAIAAVALTAKLWWHRLLVLLGIRKRTLLEKRPPADKK
ncbi:MAG TPA: hypothetical protein VGN70_12635 [Gammaproteobacteria bacterium]